MQIISSVRMFYGFLCVSWTVSAATVCTIDCIVHGAILSMVCTASSHVKRSKRVSTAVPKTSKKGEECLYIVMRSNYHSV